MKEQGTPRLQFRVTLVEEGMGRRFLMQPGGGCEELLPEGLETDEPVTLISLVGDAKEVGQPRAGAANLRSDCLCLSR